MQRIETVISAMQRHLISAMPKPKLCVVCGKRKGKHYFGIAKIPVGKGEYKYLYTSKIGKHEYKVVKWTGKEKKVEQWECDKCWNDSKE